MTNLTWILTVSYKGYSRDKDRAIYDCIGRPSVDAGLGFGARDHNFEFDTYEEAMTAGKRLVDKIKLEWLNISVYSENTYIFPVS